MIKKQLIKHLPFIVIGLTLAILTRISLVVVSRDFTEVLFAPTILSIKGPLFYEEILYDGGIRQVAYGFNAFGISGFPFPVYVACDYHDIVQGILLRPTCDGESGYGEFSIILNMLFWSILTFSAVRVLSKTKSLFDRKKIALYRVIHLTHLVHHRQRRTGVGGRRGVGGNSARPTNFGRNQFEFFRTHTAKFYIRDRIRIYYTIKVLVFD